jgi:hypothetical protein
MSPPIKNVPSAFSGRALARGASCSVAVDNLELVTISPITDFS